MTVSTTKRQHSSTFSSSASSCATRPLRPAGAPPTLCSSSQPLPSALPGCGRYFPRQLKKQGCVFWLETALVLLCWKLPKGDCTFTLEAEAVLKLEPEPVTEPCRSESGGQTQASGSISHSRCVTLDACWRLGLKLHGYGTSFRFKSDLLL